MKDLLLLIYGAMVLTIGPMELQFESYTTIHTHTYIHIYKYIYQKNRFVGANLFCFCIHIITLLRICINCACNEFRWISNRKSPREASVHALENGFRVEDALRSDSDWPCFWVVC